MSWSNRTKLLKAAKNLYHFYTSKGDVRMKNLIVLVMIFGGSGAWACPDFSGDWRNFNGSVDYTWAQKGCTTATFVNVDSQYGYTIEVPLDGTPVPTPN